MPELRRKPMPCNNYNMLVLQGTYDHATVEPVTTHLLFLASINKIPNVYVTVSKTSVGPKLPCVDVDGISLTNRSMVKVLEQLSKMRLTLTATQIRKMIYYRERILKDLEPAVFLHIWYNTENRDYAIELHTQAMINPFKYLQTLYLKCYSSYSIDRSEAIFPKAILLLETFETILRTKPFLLTNLSYLDIHLCAYLYHVVMVDYPDKTFKNLVKKHAPILFAYVQKFARRYGHSHYSSFYKNVTHRFDTRVQRPDTLSQCILRISVVFTISVVATAAISILAMKFFDRYTSKTNNN